MLLGNCDLYDKSVSGLRDRCRSVLVLVIKKSDDFVITQLHNYRPNKTPLSPLTNI